MKNSAVFFKDTYILKVHQLNRISDFKYLSCEPGCGTWSIYEKYFPCFHRTRKILEMQFKCAFNAFLSIYILVFFSDNTGVSCFCCNGWTCGFHLLNNCQDYLLSAFFYFAFNLVFKIQRCFIINNCAIIWIKNNSYHDQYQ